MAQEWISIGGARQHNLKNLSLRLPRNRLIVITGLSGSGKSSLAFDTIFAEGQRKYVESLSAYARQFLDQMQKPDVDFIEGLSPAIAIEQRSSGVNPRSTIATTTEIFDFLRLLYAAVGQPHCPKCGKPIRAQTPQELVDRLLADAAGRQLMLLAPLVRRKKGEFRDVFERLRNQGFVRVRVDGETHEMDKIFDRHGPTLRLDKTRLHDLEVVVDRLPCDARFRSRIAESVETALQWGQGLLLAMTRPAPKPGAAESAAPWDETLHSTMNACVPCGISLGAFTPRHFSFNSPYGACPACHGIGQEMVFDPDLVVPDPEKSVNDGAIQPWRRGGRRLLAYYKMLLRNVCAHLGVDPDAPWASLREPARAALLHGTGKEEVVFKTFRNGRPYSLVKPFEGVIPQLQRLFAETASEFTRKRLRSYQTFQPCGACRGARLKRESLAVTFGGESIIGVSRFSVKEALRFFAALNLDPQRQAIARPALREVVARLEFLDEVGLGYLTLDRESATLSGGEAQRIKLATQIGSKLSGVIYVLDEPSIGLHQRDNQRLLATLVCLRDLGNTVIVVEHDEETIRAAGHVVDLGPGAGVRGGELVAQGSVAEVMANPRSLTGRYLTGELGLVPPKRRIRPKDDWLRVVGARENNLKDLTVGFPIGLFTCVTGVSGSGKSTLVDDILRRALQRRLHGAKERPGKHERLEGTEFLDKVIVIDQAPIGRTPRSNPLTYTGAFGQIRDLFAALPASKVRGYGPGRYSFNVRGGRCERCSGDGILKIEMHFLPDVYVECETCGGRRYNRETLEVTYKGRNIAEVLDMTVDEGIEFFRGIPSLRASLSVLGEVGLGYLRLGQQATTLSGGEAQRVKLAAELARRSTGRTLYLLDEPTTGLHFADIEKLLEVLLRLRAAGNTLLVIEHNLDVIQAADWVVDLGPEGGEAGGRIVVAGTPETVAACPESHTGRALAPRLKRRAGAPAPASGLVASPAETPAVTENALA
ncbi:MAG: excinuclease ABC subunit UvrA [Verrucomicrobiae bacterium]|nr:excinuclease ABC subunit UvrA [Verrucomicrobiae bacterium]